MSEENTQNIENIVGVQLGSNQGDLAKGKIDIDRLGKISDEERDCIAFFKQTHKYLGGDWVRSFFSDYQNLGVGVDGLGRNQIIQVIGASRGVNSTMIVDKPPLLERVFNRDWRQKLEAEGYQVRE